MTMDHSVTPRMTRHALARCQEMEIPARVPKGMFRNPALVYPGKVQGHAKGPRFVLTSDLHPAYALIVEDRPDGPWVITVVFRTPEQYARNGATFTPEEKP